MYYGHLSLFGGEKQLRLTLSLLSSGKFWSLDSVERHSSSESKYLKLMAQAINLTDRCQSPTRVYLHPIGSLNVSVGHLVIKNHSRNFYLDPGAITGSVVSVGSLQDRRQGSYNTTYGAFRISSHTNDRDSAFSSPNHSIRIA